MWKPRQGEGRRVLSMGVGGVCIQRIGKRWGEGLLNISQDAQDRPEPALTGFGAWDEGVQRFLRGGQFGAYLLAWNVGAD